MAILNGLYIHVESENVSREASILEHPVEEGFNVSDHIKNRPTILNLSGKIVDYEQAAAREVVSRLEEWQRKGVLINYTGRNIMTGALITSFDARYDCGNAGGCDFELELKHVLVARSPATISSSTGTGALKQVEKNSTSTNIYHIVKKGDTIWGLVNRQYRGYGFDVNWIIANNPTAFSRKLPNGTGDPRTLQIGRRIVLGGRQ